MGREVPRDEKEAEQVQVEGVSREDAFLGVWVRIFIEDVRIFDDMMFERPRPFEEGSGEDGESGSIFGLVWGEDDTRGGRVWVREVDSEVNVERGVWGNFERWDGGGGGVGWSDWLCGLKGIAHGVMSLTCIEVECSVRSVE